MFVFSGHGPGVGREGVIKREREKIQKKKKRRKRLARGSEGKKSISKYWRGCLTELARDGFRRCILSFLL